MKKTQLFDTEILYYLQCFIGANEMYNFGTNDILIGAMA